MESGVGAVGVTECRLDGYRRHPALGALGRNLHGLWANEFAHSQL